jgi:beta-glucosidase-like glycosyl hydrolase
MRYVILLFLVSMLQIHAGEWAEKTLQTLSLDEKIGQLFIVGSYSNREDAIYEGQHEDPLAYVEQAIQKFHIGSILFKKRWEPDTLAHSTHHFQLLSRVPLLTMQDLEYGLMQRHTKAPRFPKHMTLGAIQNNRLIYELGREIAHEAKMMGLHCNLAPVVDVNSNPLNPIIFDRSFGDNPEHVATKALLYMQGLHDEGVLSCAKHFPGHGDTQQDSHEALPTIYKTKEQLKACELIPFQKLIDEHVPCVMLAHILVPSLDASLPCSLSYHVATELLQHEMGFKGIVMTDDLLMKAISSHFSMKEAAVLAFQAGVHLIMCSKDIDQCVAGIQEAVQSHNISEDTINERVRRILEAKEWILKQKKIPFDHEALFSPAAKALKERLYAESQTLVHPEHLLKNFSNASYVQIGGTHNTPFSKELARLHTGEFYLSSQPTSQERQNLFEHIQQFDCVIISLFDLKDPKMNFGITDEICTFLQELRSRKIPALFVLFGSPYVLRYFHDDEPCLVSYEDDPDSQKAAASVILGKMEALGKLPIKQIQ